MRLNTRETRVLTAMRDRRLDLIEELIKRLPGYKPPADYRCASAVALPARLKLVTSWGFICH